MNAAPSDPAPAMVQVAERQVGKDPDLVPIAPPVGNPLQAAASVVRASAGWPSMTCVAEKTTSRFGQMPVMKSAFIAARSIRCTPVGYPRFCRAIEPGLHCGTTGPSAATGGACPLPGHQARTGLSSTGARHSRAGLRCCSTWDAASRRERSRTRPIRDTSTPCYQLRLGPVCAKKYLGSNLCRGNMCSMVYRMVGGGRDTEHHPCSSDQDTVVAAR